MTFLLGLYCVRGIVGMGTLTTDGLGLYVKTDNNIFLGLSYNAFDYYDYVKWRPSWAWLGQWLGINKISND